jgi:hypothetical protein
METINEYVDRISNVNVLNRNVNGNMFTSPV